jgi:hypothetical protein
VSQIFNIRARRADADALAYALAGTTEFDGAPDWGATTVWAADGAYILLLGCCQCWTPGVQGVARRRAWLDSTCVCCAREVYPASRRRRRDCGGRREGRGGRKQERGLWGGFMGWHRSLIGGRRGLAGGWAGSVRDGEVRRAEGAAFLIEPGRYTPLES